MRYDVLVFDFSVLGPESPDTVSRPLQDLSDLGVTLALVSDIPEPSARAALGRAQHLFDAYDCGGNRRGIDSKLRRIARRLAAPYDRVLLVTASPEDIVTSTELGVRSAVPTDAAGQPGKVVATHPTHVIVELFDLIAILSGNPMLRLVHQPDD
jgi:phosphoglycolate phosphatase-like HAD superfamily hydrolase